MGRELRRVPLDFDWPMNQRWSGFVNPHYAKCQRCDGRGDTMASLARRMAYSNYQAERFQVLNRLTASSRLTPGQKVKIVVYASR